MHAEQEPVEADQDGHRGDAAPTTSRRWLRRRTNRVASTRVTPAAHAMAEEWPDGKDPSGRESSA